MNKRILTSLSVIGVVAAIVAGGTIAYLNDTEESKANAFVSGSLDLEVNNENPCTSTVFDISDVKPGDSGTATIRLKNVGSLPKPDGSPWISKVYIAFENLQDDDASCSEPESEVDDTCGSGQEGELSEKLNVTVRDFWDPNCQNNKRFEETHTLAEWVNDKGKTFLNDDMPSGDVNCIVIDWSVPIDAGNIIQSDKATFDIKFILEQTEPWE
ncbi:hypothetical protein DRH29_04405 [candidate division Kazan bacterium]|uniref:SipW-cognate class signal peptide n=1 Tax=candidate division Kazan bacterium TaxID=2202143 RepID=A0A420ZBN5_UNCK3|nr:MAG: hypothetical protein DRH29_04405 [candidate division Kazan bacterium]